MYFINFQEKKKKKKKSKKGAIDGNASDAADSSVAGGITIGASKVGIDSGVSGGISVDTSNVDIKTDTAPTVNINGGGSTSLFGGLGVNGGIEGDGGFSPGGIIDSGVSLNIPNIEKREVIVEDDLSEHRSIDKPALDFNVRMLNIC